MSSPILPIQGPQGPHMSAPPAPARACNGMSFRSELEASRREAAGQAHVDAPPPEVLEEIAAAGRTNEELRASGRRVCFTQDEHGGRIGIELRGSEGKMLRELSITEALDLAAGKPLS